MAGTSITALVRDLLVHRKLVETYDQAVEFSQEIDKVLHEASWLELADGTTFEKSTRSCEHHGKGSTPWS